MNTTTPHRQQPGRPPAWRWAGLAAGLGLVALAALPLLAAEKPKDIPGSRAVYTHRVELFDQQDPPKLIRATDEMPLPFSFKSSCNKCHEYATVSKGWHFNAMDPKVEAGRAGEPWFWIDRRTGTQLPVSYRAWPNTWQPNALGLTPWKFVLMFGRHMPGGGPGEATNVEDSAARWLVSGKFEINCQSCHSGDPQYDQIASFLQVGGAQNFMWASAATTDLANVTGSAKAMADSYDPFLGPESDQVAKTAPGIIYDKTKFDSKGKVFFNIPTESPNARCYFCHSTREVGKTAPDMWKTDQDVHLTAGLSCSDCHRNGLDHAISRGYEGEPGSDDPKVASLSCRGCHLGAQSAAAGPETMGGRLRAPVPTHVGLPTIHIEHLECTTCHSGPRATMQATRIQTSRAHALEFQGDFRGDDALPLIQNPVFVRREDGKIGPQRMAWPAFWARIDGEKVTPLSPDDVYKVGKAEFEKKAAGEKLPRLTPDKIIAVLALLAEDKAAKGEPVYIAGGKLYKVGAREGVATDLPAAQPVSWAIAHDVRPAARALGSGGCTDCHAAESPVFFGTVLAEAPGDLGDPTAVPMYTLLGKDPTELKAWVMSYQFRPMFKAVGFTTAGLIAAVLLAYLLMGLVALARWAAQHAPQRPN